MKKILIGGRDNPYKNYTAALDALKIPWKIDPVCHDVSSFSGLFPK